MIFINDGKHFILTSSSSSSFQVAHVFQTKSPNHFNQFILEYTGIFNLFMLK